MVTIREMIRHGNIRRLKEAFFLLGSIVIGDKTLNILHLKINTENPIWKGII